MKTRLIIALNLSIILVAGLVMTGCKNQKAAVAHIGVYTLITVDGKQVPAEISHEGTPLKISSGTFIINGDGTCSTTTVFVPPAGTEVSREVSATYTKKGSALYMQWKGAGSTVGTVKGSTFTMNNEGIILVYRK